MPRRRSMRTRRTGPLRKREWARQLTTQVLFTRNGGDTNTRLAVSLTDSFQTALGMQMLLPGCTVAAVHVDYSFLITQTANQPINTEEGVTWGIISGGYSVDPGDNNQPPSTLTQPHEDWQWWEHTPFQPTSSNSQAATTSVGRGSGPILVRSKRKLDELGSDVFVVAEFDDGVVPPAITSMDLTATFITSCLLLLP